jgi:photosystem II stability/assembly factor-like uncharacterized protein
MKQKLTLFLLASIASSFLLFSCTDKGGMKTIFLPSESSASSGSNIVGAQSVATFADLPRCNILTRGLLFYIQSPTVRFVYCGADNTFHDINLIGPAGPQGPVGQNGIGITWLGELPSAPATANINDAYYDTAMKEARIYTATGWQVMSKDGVNGAPGLPGQDGIGIIWLGSFDAPPAFPNINDAYYNTVQCKSFIYTATGWQVLTKDGAQGPQGPAGQDGISIVWLGSLTDFPTIPTINNAFYHVTEGRAYIWDGDSWEILCQDGESAVTEANEITSFAFMKAVNPGLSEDVQGVITGTNITIHVQCQDVITNLIASFATTGEHVIVNGIVQESGVSENDFSKVLVYVVVSVNGLPRIYSVTVEYDSSCPKYKYYLDNDGDGFGLSSDYKFLEAPEGNHTATVDGDCNDDNGSINPGVVESCNGLDDDCDGVVDEGFNHVGNQCFVGVGICMRMGFYACTIDGTSEVCNVSAGTPEAEICNGLDDDCDGVVDEGCGMTPHESERKWVAVASSANGAKLVAMTQGEEYDYIYTSTNFGKTWTVGEEWGPWESVASSADGTKLVAGTYGPLYISADSGETWTDVEGTFADWVSVASSAWGDKLFAASMADSICMSTDFGKTWNCSLIELDKYFKAVACSANGTKVAVAAYDGQIYTSTDSGVAWVARESGSRKWLSIASSADGTKLIAGSYYDQLFISHDSGVTWNARGPLFSWTSVASSSDGTRLAAAARDGQVYISTDSGETWIPIGETRAWSSVALSSDGLKLVAVVNGGQIYTASLESY